jgi:hypothetical protein
MSLTAQDEALIVHYLLGELVADEKAALEERYFLDDELFESVRSIEDELIRDFLRGVLPVDRRRRFEARYLRSPQLRRKVELARPFAQATDAPDSAAPSSGRSHEPKVAGLRAGVGRRIAEVLCNLNSGWRLAGLAAALLVFIAVFGLYRLGHNGENRASGGGAASTTPAPHQPRDIPKSAEIATGREPVAPQPSQPVQPRIQQKMMDTGRLEGPKPLPGRQVPSAVGKGLGMQQETAPLTPAPWTLPMGRPSPAGDTSGCDLVQELQSKDGTIPTEIVFFNSTVYPVQIYWIDYHGKLIKYGDLESLHYLVQPTYLTHPWVIMDRFGGCLSVHLPAKGGSAVTINPRP